MAASTWLGASVEEVHAEPDATPYPRRSRPVTSASPSTYRQENVTRWGSRSVRVADHLDVGHLGRDALADPRDQRVQPGGRLGLARRSPPATPPRRPGRRHVLEPRARSSPRSSAGNGLRHRAPLRTSRTPTPAGPPHLCADSRGRGPAVGQSQVAHGRAGVHEQGYVAEAGRDLLDGLDGPDLVVGGLHGDDGDRLSGVRDAPVHVLRRDPPDPVDRDGDRRRRRTRSSACGTAECSTALCTTTRPARRRPAARPSSPRWTAWVPLGVKVTSSGRTPRQPAATSRALSSSRRALRAGPWRRRGSAYPASSAARRTSRAAGCRGVDDAESR